MKSSMGTAAAIGAVAYAVMDMVHEAGGHWVSTLFVPGVSAFAISTVGLATHGESRIVAAAGTVANIVAGTLLLWRASRRRSFFLWLAGTINLMEIAYLAWSGVTGLGDWSVVVRGTPARIAIVAIGSYAYFLIVKIASRINDIERSAIITSYIAGSVMMVAASALNPLPHAVVQSGLPAGFGLTAGLLFVRGGSQPLPKSRAWIAAGTAVAATFIALLGPGIAIAP